MYQTYSEIYNVRGQHYHRAMALWPDARREEFEQMVKVADVRCDRPRILDIPSGGGYLARYLPAGAVLTSVDPAPEFLAAGEDKRTGEVICAPHDRVPLPDGCADHVCSLAGLHHLDADEQASAYREWARLLKPGGSVAIGDGRDGSATPRFLDGVVGAYNRMGHRGLYLADETASVIESAGLRVTFAEEVAYSWNFRDVAEMLSFCRVLFCLDLEPTDAELLEGIRDTVGYTEADGGCRMGWSLFFIRAEKPI